MVHGCIILIFHHFCICGTSLCCRPHAVQLNGLFPQYIPNDCQCQLITATTCRRLWLPNGCYVRGCKNSHKHDQSFMLPGLYPWNNLPLNLCDSELEFHPLLKTRLFSWGPLRLVTDEHVRNVFIYLLSCNELRCVLCGLGDFQFTHATAYHMSVMRSLALGLKTELRGLGLRLWDVGLGLVVFGLVFCGHV